MLVDHHWSQLMLPKSPYLAHLADFVIPERPARNCDPLPAATALPLILAMSLLLWSAIATIARALI
jgi:hypothetical protein